MKNLLELIRKESEKDFLEEDFEIDNTFYVRNSQIPDENDDLDFDDE